MIKKDIFQAYLLLFVFSVNPAGLSGQEKRSMELEDIMNFHHMQSPVISYEGNWVSYAAWPDRGDGYGVIVSSDNKTERVVERAVNPRFSHRGNWVMFTIRPPLSETEGKTASERPKDKAVVIDPDRGLENLFYDVMSSSFSTIGQLLFVHHHHVPDTTMNEENNKKMEKAGSPLLVRNLAKDEEIILHFVDRWTVDSLSTTLVFTLKDTLEKNNGLYFISLQNIFSPPSVIDTTNKVKFGGFTWYERGSKLIYMRADDMESDSAETASLFLWERSSPEPVKLLTQDKTPEGYFLPFDNDLGWSITGNRIFLGLRPDIFAAVPEKNGIYESVLDSIRQKAGVDVWHGEDPLIKTHEKSVWNQIRRQNLISVFHLDEKKLIQLADEELTDVLPSYKGDYAMAWTYMPHSKRITWEGRFRDIYVINMLNGNRKLVETGMTDLATLSPDAGYLLYFKNNNWHSYDIRSEKKVNLTEGIGTPFYDETNDLPFEAASYRMAGWIDDGKSALIYDRYDIWRADLGSGNIRNITAGYGREWSTMLRIRKMDDEPLYRNRDEVLIEGFNENTKVRAIYSARLDREGVNSVLDEGTNLRLRIMSGDKGAILYTREAYDEFPDLWVTGKRFKNRVRVSNLNSQIEPFNWGTAELVSFTSADGIPLQGVVIKPGNYDPSERYPVFVYFYEKFSQRLHDFNQTVINHRPSFGYYASNGYVVFLPDIHFKVGRPGMSAVNSLVPGVRKLVDLGIAEPGAIGLHGHSWSGYQAAYVVTQTDIFKAAIAGAPVSNMTSAYGGIRWGSGLARQFQYETGQSRIGSSIFEKRYLYVENSPLFYANEINTPLLIMHGDVDEAVPWEQSIELYLAMRRAGRDIIFLQYRDEPHHPQKYPNKIDYTIRMKEYFDHHLRGYEPAEWILKGVPYRGN